MPKRNLLSHREQHRLAARSVGGGPDATSTGDDYRKVRRATAALRRDEQRRSRLADGTDRACARRRPAPGPRSRIPFLDAQFGR